MQRLTINGALAPHEMGSENHFLLVLSEIFKVTQAIQKQV